MGRARRYEPAVSSPDLEALLRAPDSPDTAARVQAWASANPLILFDIAGAIAQDGQWPVAAVTQAAQAASGTILTAPPAELRAAIEPMLMGREVDQALEWVRETGLLAQVFPELEATVHLQQETGRQHKDVWSHTKQVVKQSVRRPLVRWAALLHDIGKPATRRHEADGGVSFHHHEVVGAKMTRKRMRTLKYSKQMVDDVSQLVYLHLRFHGYGDGRWTDSAVRRYVTDAGPLLPRLHKLVRADCTTRNKRRAARLQATYDELEHRIADLAAREDLARVRPDLDGNEIMELLGIPAGPQVGEAWKYLKELRLERGPLDPDEARAELLAWWNAKADRTV